MSYLRHNMSSYWCITRKVKRRKNIRPHYYYGFFDLQIIQNSQHVRVFPTRGFERSEVDNYSSVAPYWFWCFSLKPPLSLKRSLVQMERGEGRKNTASASLYCSSFLFITRWERMLQRKNASRKLYREIIFNCFFSKKWNILLKVVSFLCARILYLNQMGKYTCDNMLISLRVSERFS